MNAKHLRRTLAALLLLAAVGLAGCEPKKRDYAPKQPILQYNAYDKSMDPYAQTAPILP